MAIICVLGVNMTYSPNVLDLSGNKTNSQTSQSADLSELIAQWNIFEGRLKKILNMHDDSMRDQSISSSTTDELLDLLVQVENEQKCLLAEIARLPSRNMCDVIAKLKIWESVVMPTGGDPLMAQPSDLLVASALSDLKSGALKTS